MYDKEKGWVPIDYNTNKYKTGEQSHENEYKNEYENEEGEYTQDEDDYEPEL